MRRLPSKFRRPRVRFSAQRITEERAVLEEYGLRRKRELWRTEAIMRNMRQRARRLIAAKDAEGEKTLLRKLAKLGLLKGNATLDDVLALARKDLLERRLQTMVLRRGFAKTPMEARQFIVHGHIYVRGRRLSYPSYIVPADEENLIEFRLARKETKHGREKEEAKGNQGQEREGAGGGEARETGEGRAERAAAAG